MCSHRRISLTDKLTSHSLSFACTPSLSTHLLEKTRKKSKRRRLKSKKMPLRLRYEYSINSIIRAIKIIFKSQIICECKDAFGEDIKRCELYYV